MFDYNEYDGKKYIKYVRKMFPSVLTDNANSNNQKWLTIVANTMIDLIDRIMVSYNNHDFRKANGDDLQKIAQDWGISPSDDEKFLKFEIALMMLKRHLGSDENSIIKLIANTLGADVKEFTVETRRSKNNNEPERIGIYDIPPQYMDNKNSEELLYRTLLDILGDEVNLYTIEFNKKYNGYVYIAIAMVSCDIVCGTLEG